MLKMALALNPPTFKLLELAADCTMVRLLLPCFQVPPSRLTLALFVGRIRLRGPATWTLPSKLTLPPLAVRLAAVAKLVVPLNVKEVAVRLATTLVCMELAVKAPRFAGSAV